MDLHHVVVVIRVVILCTSFVLFLQRGRSAKIACSTLSTMSVPKFRVDGIRLIVQVIAVQFVQILGTLPLLLEGVCHSTSDTILGCIPIGHTNKRPSILTMTRVHNTFIIQIPLGNPSTFQCQHVRPLRFVEVSTKVPKVESVTNAREGANLLERKEFHDLVRSIATAGGLGRGHDPGHTALAAIVAFSHPVTIDGTETEGWSTHSGSVGSLHRFANINWSSRLFVSHVGIRAGDVLARTPWKSWQVIIETIEPHGTIVRGKTPLSHDDRTKLSFHEGNLLLLRTSVVVEGETRRWIHPGLVDVGIQSTVRATLHKPTPSLGSKPKRIMHNKLPIRRLFLHNQIGIPIKCLQ
mmetsp:Transcript_26423/g.55790  ORF Transcript_26423/g.55790 Transcript_26423/m.55790 type:complete len:352 (+) Transcript_26423:1165-2220(+)